MHHDLPLEGSLIQPPCDYASLKHPHPQWGLVIRFSLPAMSGIVASILLSTVTAIAAPAVEGHRLSETPRIGWYVVLIDDIPAILVTMGTLASLALLLFAIGGRWLPLRFSWLALCYVTGWLIALSIVGLNAFEVL